MNYIYIALLGIFLATMPVAIASNRVIATGNLNPTVKLIPDVVCKISLNQWVNQSANALIIRVRTKMAKTPPVGITGIFNDGAFQVEKPLNLVNQVEGNYEFDYELPLGKTIILTTSANLTLKIPPSFIDTIEIYAVQAVLFDDHDLSGNINFESDSRNGVWVGNYTGIASINDDRAIAGKRSLKAFWPTHGGMVTLLPGERDWSEYAELRISLANPLPTANGKRTRVIFIFDGKKHYRPTQNDSIPGGALTMNEESGKTFKLDLNKLRANLPKADWKNITALQIFWSPVRCGETILYVDNIQLLTQYQVVQETTQKYQSEFAELRKSASLINLTSDKFNSKMIDFEKRFAAGERNTLDPEITALKEYLVTEQFRKESVAGKKFALAAAHPAVKIMQDAKFPSQAFPNKISAAGNERESFQLVVVPFEGLKQVKISATELKNPNGKVIPIDNIEINPVAYIEITDAYYFPSSRNGFWPDVLLDNSPFDLPVKVQPYMITVAVPENQEPGLYSGKLSVNALGLATEEVEYQLEVYNFSLPKRGKLKTFFSDSYLPNDPKIRRSVYDKYFYYRLNPTNMYSRIDKATSSAPGIVPPLEDLPYCMERGMNFYNFGYIIDRPAKDPNTFDQAYINAIISWIGHCKPVLEKTGAWEIASICGFDEIMHQSVEIRTPRLAEAKRTLKAVKQAFPDVKTSNVGKLMDIDNSLMNEWFTVPSPGADFKEKQIKGGMVGFYWVYEDPSFMLDLPGIAPRICSWLAYKEGAEAIGYYATYRPHDIANGQDSHSFGSMPCNEKCNPKNLPATLTWRKIDFDTKAAVYRYGRNGCGKLFYPSADGHLLGSQRLVNIRDGIEDYEYLKILEQKSGGKKNKLLAIPDSIVTTNQGEYTHDYKTLQDYRDNVAKAIEQSK